MGGFLPNCDYVGTIVWMHHLDTDETHGEKARWKLHKNATSYFEQTFHKTATLQPLTSHLTNHRSKMNKIFCIIKTFFDGLLYMDRPELTVPQRLTYISSLQTQDAV